MWCLFLFFKQKTAYEMRISDWSSDVCSSDLIKSCDLSRLFRVMSNGATLNWCEPQERRLPLKARAGTALTHGQQAHCLSIDSYTNSVGILAGIASPLESS